MKHRRFAFVIIILLVLILLSYFGLTAWQHKAAAETYSGTIEATAIPVQPEAGGKIVELPIQEGQTVQAGDPLAKLDPSQALITLATAKSQLAQAQARLDDLLGGARAEEIRRLQNLVAQAQANADGVAQNLRFEQTNLADAEKLYAAGALSKQALDAQQNKVAGLQAQSAAAQANVRAAQAALDAALAGASQPTLQAQRAAVDAAAQGVKAAELALSKLTVASPINGRVLYRHVQPGQVVNAGSILATLVDPNDLWVKVYVPEAKLNQIKVGGTAYVTVDAYPGQKFQGKILYISDQAEFTPKNVQTKEERTTTVFAVKISITAGKDVLKAGMPADVTLE